MYIQTYHSVNEPDTGFICPLTRYAILINNLQGHTEGDNS